MSKCIVYALVEPDQGPFNYSFKILSEMFNISRAQVHRIVRRINWKDIKE